MWLLYGGLEQQGCALAITQGGFRDWISSINVIRAFNFDSESKSYDKGVELSNDYFSVEYGWIRYKKGNRYRCRGKYPIQQTDERDFHSGDDTFRALLQLPDACRYRHLWEAGKRNEQRSRLDGHPQPWSEKQR